MKNSIKFPSKIFSLILLGVLSGCIGGAKESDVPDAGWVAIDITANASVVAKRMPRKAYIFPPLLMDVNGNPLEQYIQTTDADGGLVWKTPSPVSLELQAGVEKRMKKEGFELVSFRTLQDAPHAHSVLIVTSYYTKHWENKVGKGRFETVNIVYVRLAGSTFPLDLDSTQKVDIFNQELLVFYNPLNPETEAVKLGLNMAAKYIGQSKHWMFSPALPSCCRPN